MRPAPPRGATLLELMVALALVALLASISVPAYRTYLLRTNRGEARAALLALAAAEESFYLKCNTYTGTLDAAYPTACSPANLAFPASSERSLYAIAVTSADLVGWTATATANAAGRQFEDTDCRVFRLTSTGIRTGTDANGSTSGSVCWSR